MHELELCLATNADQVALRTANRTARYADLTRASETLAAQLKLCGVGPGARVLMSMKASPAAWSGILAIWRLGAVPVPLDLLGSRALEDLIKRCDPTAHLIDTECWEVVRQVYASLERAMPVLVPPCPGRNPEQGAAPHFCGWHKWQPDDEALIGFSSGTTGRPKGIVHTCQSLIAGVDNSAASLGLSSGDTVLSVNSFFQIWSIVGILLSGLRSGVTTVLAEPSAGSVLDAIEARQVGVLHCPTPFLIDLANEPRLGRNLNSLQRIITGGAPINASAAQDLTTALPNCAIRNGYGASEYIHASRDSVETANTPIGSCGSPIDGVEVVIRDPDERGRGQIAVKATSMMKGYLHDPVQSAWSFTDGYFLTGDCGCIENGQLRVFGRMKDIVEVRGKRLLLSEIECLVSAEQGVKDVAAYVNKNEPSHIRLDVVAHENLCPSSNCLKSALTKGLGVKQTDIDVNWVNQIARNTNGKIVR